MNSMFEKCCCVCVCARCCYDFRIRTSDYSLLTHPSGKRILYIRLNLISHLISSGIFGRFQCFCQFRLISISCNFIKHKKQPFSPLSIVFVNDNCFPFEIFISFISQQSLHTTNIYVYIYIKIMEFHRLDQNITKISAMQQQNSRYGRPRNTFS